MALLIGASAHGQGLAADYERAATLDQRTGGKVRDAVVNPHWSADGNSFWYVVGNGPQRQTWFVDAVAAARRPATAADKTGADSGLRPLRRPHPSRNAGPETTLTFVNKTAGPVTIYWVDDQGERQKYADVPPGGRYDQHTYAGHVWMATDAKGRSLGAFEAIEGDAEAVLGVAEAPPPATRPAGAGAGVVGGVRRLIGRIEKAAGESPDGRWTASVQDGNVWLTDAKTAARTQLTRDAAAGVWYEADALHWSPDSKHLVALRTTDGGHRIVHIVQSSPPDQEQPKLLSIEYPKPGDKIPITQPHLFDVAAGREINIDHALFDNPWEGGDDDLRWDDDGRRFTFYYNQRGHQVARVVAVDADTGAATAVVDEHAKTFIDYSGKKFLQFLSDDELVWMSERDGWNHLFLIDAKTGRVKDTITPGDWVVRGVDRIDPKTRQIWFQAGGLDPKQDPYYVHYCRANLDGSDLVDLTPGDGTHKVQYSPDGRFYLDTYSRVDLPPVNELRRASDGKLVCPLEKADATDLLATGWRYPERFVAKGRDGATDIYGVIFRPTNFDPAKKYPVIEDIYAGPQDSEVPKAFVRGTSGLAMAELGFIVVQIDGMGTSNRSKAFHDVCWRNLADAGFPDRILWIKAAAAKHPEMDLSRGVGIYGGSAGGQNALGALEFHPEFYTVAVADCGCHDNRMDKIWWNEQWMGWPIGPWYAEQSNVTHANNVQGALLLMVGETDHNVDPASTMQVVNALEKANKDFDLLVMTNADHCQDGSYGDRRRKDFFVRHLLGVEPPHRNATTQP